MAASRPRPGNDRVPPHNIDAEAALLGAALLNRDAAGGLPRPGEFYKPAHQFIADAMRALFAAEEPVDVITVSESLRRSGLLEQIGGIEAVNALYDATPASSNWRSYATAVTNSHSLRNLLGVASEIADIAYSEPSDVANAVAKARHRIDETSEHTETAVLQIADMQAIFDGGITPETPTLLERTDGACLFFLGKMHSIVAEGGTGKGWVALLTAVQVLAAGGSVVYLDYEDTPKGIFGRLIALGADPKAVIERFHHITPEGALTPAKKAKLGKLLRDSNPDLIIVDAWIGALTSEGFSEDKSEDIEAWAETVGRWLIRESGGAALVILDHVAKDIETRGKWARGSGRKLDVIDGAIYAMKTVVAFSMVKPGSANLVCNKCRPGTYAVGSVVAVADVRPAGAGELMRIALNPKLDEVSSGDTWAPTHTMELISAAIIEAPAAMSATSIGYLFPNMKKSIWQGAIARLLKEGYIRESRTRGRSKTFVSLRPYYENGIGVVREQGAPPLFDPEPPEDIDNVIRGPWADTSWSPDDPPDIDDR